MALFGDKFGIGIGFGNPDINFKSAEQQDYARKMAEELLKRKAPENMRHWTQGAAYLLDTLAGMKYQNIAGLKDYDLKSGQHPELNNSSTGTTGTTGSINSTTPPQITPESKAQLDALNPDAKSLPQVPGITLGEMPEGMTKLPTAPNATPADTPYKSSDSGAWNKRINVPWNGTPASVRANNPGASWTRPQDDKYGVEGYDIIGGGNRIGKFPTVEQGLASNMDLMATGKAYMGKTLGQATATWRGGNPGSNMTPRFEMSDGTKIGPNTVITPELANNKEFMTKVFSHYAEHEAGRGKSKVSKDQFDKAFDIYSAGGIDNYNKKLAEKAAADKMQPNPLIQAGLKLNPENEPSQNNTAPAPTPVAANPNDPLSQPMMGLGGPKPDPQSQEERRIFAQAQTQNDAPIAGQAQGIPFSQGVPGTSQQAPIVQPGMSDAELRTRMFASPAKDINQVYDKRRESYAPQEITPKGQFRVGPNKPGQPSAVQYLPDPNGPTLKKDELGTQRVQGPNGEIFNAAAVPGVVPGTQQTPNNTGIPVPTVNDGIKAIPNTPEEIQKQVSPWFDMVGKLGASSEGQRQIVAKNLESRQKFIDEGYAATENLNHIRTLQGLNGAYDKLLFRGPGNEKYAQVLQMLDNWVPGGINKPGLKGTEMFDKVSTGLALGVDHELGSRGSNLKLKMVEQANPGLRISSEGSKGMLDLLAQSMEQKQQFARKANKMGPLDSADMTEEYQKFMREHPLTTEIPKGTPYTPDGKGKLYLQNFKTKEEMEKIVKPGEFFLGKNGNLLRRSE